MVTCGNEGVWKVWDLRNYKMIYDYWSPKLVKSTCISQKNILALGMGQDCQLWKDWWYEKQKAPYMKHETNNNKVI